MEDFKVIFYILLAIGYFIFNFFRKNFKEDNSQPKKFRDENAPPVQRPQQRPPVPVTSFEDILRELQPKVEQAKSTAKTIVEPKRPVPAPQYNVSKYEHAQPEAVSLERTVKKRPAIAQHDAYAAYSVKPTAKIPKFDPAMLRNPQSVRDAFILSEIFNRKY